MSDLGEQKRSRLRLYYRHHLAFLSLETPTTEQIAELLTGKDVEIHELISQLDEVSRKYRSLMGQSCGMCAYSKNNSQCEQCEFTESGPTRWEPRYNPYSGRYA